MTLLKYLTSRIFVKQLLYAIGIVIALLLITFLTLRIYTHHGQAIPVSDYRGLSLEDALQQAKKDRFRIEVIDSVFNNSRPKGSVIEQNPKPGFKVKKNRRVFIVLNAFNPEKVKMPNVVGVSHRQAESVLKNSGLEIGKLIHVPDIAVNNVLKQKFEGEEIEVGTMIPKGSKIDLVLGMGLSNQTTPVPNLDHYTLADAKSRILRAALNMGAIIYDKSITDYKDSLDAKVWRQYPSYKENKMLRLGSTVDIWLTVDSTILYPETPLDTLNFNE